MATLPKSANVWLKHTKTGADSFTHHKEFFPETACQNLP
jgi:hypothetical protein